MIHVLPFVENSLKSHMFENSDQTNELVGHPRLLFSLQVKKLNSNLIQYGETNQIWRFGLHVSAV